MDATTPNTQPQPFSIKLWPPSENTRIMLVDRMTKNLSCPTIFTQKYGSLSKEEAVISAKQIEDIAYATATHHYGKGSDGDGSFAVQLYAKECSKLVIEVLKSITEAEEEKKIVKSEVFSGSRGKTFFDISKGPRAFIEADEARELLQPLMEPGSSYTKICFSNRSFGFGAAHVAEPILVSLRHKLREVDLSDFIAGRPESEALEVMNIFSKALDGCDLKSLNLSNNALGEKGVRAFGSLLKSQTHLEELYLMNDGISEKAARSVCELIPSTERLRVLHFHNNMTGDEGAVAISQVIKQAPLLEDFRCSSTRIDSEGGTVLSEALETCANLKKLDLRDNMFGIEAGLTLSKSLYKHVNLTELYISYLNLEDDGAISISNVLKQTAQNLEVLEMAGNDITADAAPSLASCIESKHCLTRLNLAENEFKDEGTTHISKALEKGHDKLEEVDMSINCIRRVGAQVLAEALVHKPAFKFLNLNGNFISDEGIEELKRIFEKSPHLLGSLDENDPEGGDEDDDDYELESDLNDLNVNGKE